MNDEQKKNCNIIAIKFFEQNNPQELFSELGFLENKGHLQMHIVVQKKYKQRIQEVIPAFMDSINVSAELKYFYKGFTDSEIDKFDFYFFYPRTTIKKYIFKYQSINDNLYSLLINNSIWFGEAKNFKDPFDCRYVIDAKNREKDILFFYFSMKYYNPNIDMSVLYQLFYEKFAKSFRIPTFEVFLKDLEKHHFQNTFSKKFGISCFTERYDNVLMWAHYANNFKGVCLVFDWKKRSGNEYHKFAGSKVKYRNKLINYYFLPNSAEMESTHIFYSKLNQWSYEQEIRELVPIDQKINKREFNFDPKSLVGIIFGIDVSNAEKNKIKTLTEELQKYSHVELIESKIDLRTQKILLMKNKLLIK